MKNFNEKCYDVLKRVPKGYVVTYKDIARKLNSRAYRAVGNSMKQNYNKKIPCHRVINSNGNVGEYNRGKKNKIKLLKKEGVIVINNRVDMKKYRFKF